MLDTTLHFVRDDDVILGRGVTVDEKPVVNYFKDCSRLHREGEGEKKWEVHSSASTFGDLQGISSTPVS